MCENKDSLYCLLFYLLKFIYLLSNLGRELAWSQSEAVIGDRQEAGAESGTPGSGLSSLPLGPASLRSQTAYLREACESDFLCQQLKRYLGNQKSKKYTVSDCGVWWGTCSSAGDNTDLSFDRPGT